MGPMRAMAVLVAASLTVVPSTGGEESEARVSIDVREAPVDSIVSLLVELGGRQVVFDPGLACPLTLKLHEVRWRQALDTTLRACGLGQDETGGVLWVATLARLREEAESRRRLTEAESPDSGAGSSCIDSPTPGRRRCCPSCDASWPRRGR